MTPYLAMTTINTFQKLLGQVARFEKLPKQKDLNTSLNKNSFRKGKQSKAYHLKKNYVNTMFTFRVDKKEMEVHQPYESTYV